MFMVRIVKSLQLSDDQWYGFEIKLRSIQIDETAKNLLEINQSIIEEQCGKPAKVLCVICGLTNAAYKRPDGVYVVPITAFKN